LITVYSVLVSVDSDSSISVTIHHQTHVYMNYFLTMTATITSGLSTLTRIEKAVKNTTLFVIYKVLLYIQISQPTICFGLF